MAKKSTSRFPQVFASNRQISEEVSDAAAAGLLQKIGPRLYTTDVRSTPEEVVRLHRWTVAGILMPGAVVGYRSILDPESTPEVLFLTWKYRRSLSLPGLTLNAVKGPGALPGDMPFQDQLFFASRPRALLESLRPSRSRDGLARGLRLEEVEELLERLVRIDDALANRIRDEARDLAPKLNAEREFEHLDEMLGRLLGTRGDLPDTPRASARRAGERYDPERLGLFDSLQAALRKWVSSPRHDAVLSGTPFKNLAFLDAYFSNYIEGTEFEVEEAANIVFGGAIPANRPADAHDILGTFRVVSDPVEMSIGGSRSPADFDGFLDLLKRRHYLILEGRPDKRPGELKQIANRAGSTRFVDPELVRGTLRIGWQMLQTLEDPFHRAAFMMFLLTEVHPFDDGNGRVARAVMNAELISGGARRILVPTSRRYDYLAGLKRMSRHGDATPFLRMLDYMQEFSASLDTSHLPQALRTLRERGAFEEPERHDGLNLADLADSSTE